VYNGQLDAVIGRTPLGFLLAVHIDAVSVDIQHIRRIPVRKRRQPHRPHEARQRVQPTVPHGSFKCGASKEPAALPQNEQYFREHRNELRLGTYSPDRIPS
jgi:hypothetical protein